MKNKKNRAGFLAAFLVASLFVTPVPAYAEDILLNEDGVYSFTVNDTKAGNLYMIRLIRGKYKSVTASELSELSDSDYLYIDQKKASGSSLTFSIIPRANEESTILLSGSEEPLKTAGHILSHIHSMQHVELKNPTILSDGNIEYYICTDCNRWFKDPEGEEEITDKDSVIIPVSRDFNITEPVSYEYGSTAITMQVRSAKHVNFNGKSHRVMPESGEGKTTASYIEDIQLLIDSEILDFATPKYSLVYNRYPSNKVVKLSKTPRITISFIAKKGATKEQKRLITLVNKGMRKQPVYFAIDPADLGRAESMNIKLNKKETKVTKASAVIDGLELKLKTGDYTYNIY